MAANPISVIGGSGALGSGLAERLARAGHRVVVGSRLKEKADDAAERLGAATGGDVTGDENHAAAEAAAIVFVAVPFANQAATLREIAPVVRGKIVVDTTVPLCPPKVARVQLPPQGSAAAIAAACLNADTRLVTAFHNVSADKLRGGDSVDGDVLVFGDDIDARQTIVDLIAAMGMSGIHGGPLDNAVAAEALTSVLIGINRRYRVAGGAGIRIAGLGVTGS